MCVILKGHVLLCELAEQFEFMGMGGDSTWRGGCSENLMTNSVDNSREGREGNIYFHLFIQNENGWVTLTNFDIITFNNLLTRLVLLSIFSKIINYRNNVFHKKGSTSFPVFSIRMWCQFGKVAFHVFICWSF